jgi:hypothetical protein
MGENPPDGAILDYDLPANVQGAVTLEILDANGTVLRTYSSTDPVAPTAQELRTNLIPAYWPKMNGPLPATAGQHRWVWDLRSTRPASLHYDYPISAVPWRTPLAPQGPLALPGTYTVRLTVDGQSTTQPLTVKMDPRVHTSPADLEALHTAEMSMCTTFDAVAKADLTAHSIQEQIGEPENAVIATQLAPFAARLKSLLGGSGQESEQHTPGLDALAGEAGPIYAQFDQADEPPPEALLAAAKKGEDEAQELHPAWDDFRTKQLPALNDVLRKAGRPAINLAQHVSDLPDEGDEE